MSAVQTALVFGGIPLLVVLLFTLVVFGPGEVRQPNRYRPGKPWNYPAVWYLPRPGAQAAGSAERRALAGHTPAAIESGEARRRPQWEEPAVSGESRTNAQLAYGPTAGRANAGQPFNSRQLSRIDEALTLSSRETGLTFSVYVGELAEPSRAAAEGLFEKLATETDGAVLLAVSPGQRRLHIVTGETSAARLPNRACALAALGMRAAFANGDLTGGIVTGLRMLADAAGSGS